MGSSRWHYDGGDYVGPKKYTPKLPKVQPLSDNSCDWQNMPYGDVVNAVYTTELAGVTGVTLAAATAANLN